jgi:hypothetical protein
MKFFISIRGLSSMNLFGFLFGKHIETKVDLTPNETIQSMKDSLSSLDKRQKYLENKKSKLRNEAKTLIKTDKKKALMLLKQAKPIEGQIAMISGQKCNLETQIFAVEQEITNRDTLEAMRHGHNALIGLSMDVEKVSDLMSDLADTIEATKETSYLLSANIGEEYDDSELDEELKQMEAEDDLKLLEEEIMIDGPVPPKSEKDPELSEDEMLKQLELEMVL